MDTKDYLAYVVRQIHTTIVATVDDDGLPVTAAIDMMDSDDNSLYFLTAKGKGFTTAWSNRGFSRSLRFHFAVQLFIGDDPIRPGMDAIHPPSPRCLDLPPSYPPPRISAAKRGDK